MYARCPLYVTGESFAGKWIPTFAAAVLDANEAMRAAPWPWRCDARGACDGRVNLRGVAIGNGVYQPMLQFTSLPELAASLGYADWRMQARARRWLAECAALLRAPSVDWRAAYFSCQRVEDRIYSGAVPFIYDVRAPRRHTTPPTVSPTTHPVR